MMEVLLIVILAFKLLYTSSASPLPDSPLTRRAEPNKNVWYLSDCNGGATIAYYDNIDNTQQGQAPLAADFVYLKHPVSWGVDDIQSKFAERSVTIPVWKQTWIPSHVLLPGRLQDKFRNQKGDWQCYQDTGRSLWKLDNVGDCKAQFYCKRVVL
ncbi:hypothetical protein BU16DRAFT_562107 [Lophium mytilinum]|uniref:Uncharacterized protein n=1 Tax=Lophium mytilinum TaxID=390894 RepID=A0A6A6QQN5_9PEZI|nr:hypothetical protein BU16DRAFT_562107 [Lophium mytilinum]